MVTFAQNTKAQISKVKHKIHDLQGLKLILVQYTEL